jgi:hypothetical protein
MRPIWVMRWLSPWAAMIAYFDPYVLTGPDVGCNCEHASGPGREAVKRSVSGELGSAQDDVIGVRAVAQ